MCQLSTNTYNRAALHKWAGIMLGITPEKALSFGVQL